MWEHMLIELQSAHATVRWQQRFGGPVRARSLLAAANDMEEPSAEDLERAHILVGLIADVPDKRQRRIISQAVSGQSIGRIAAVRMEDTDRVQRDVEAAIDWIFTRATELRDEAA
jgi:hypothetical protein